MWRGAEAEPHTGCAVGEMKRIETQRGYKPRTWLWQGVVDRGGVMSVQCRQPPLIGLLRRVEIRRLRMRMSVVTIGVGVPAGGWHTGP